MTKLQPIDYGTSAFANAKTLQRKAQILLHMPLAKIAREKEFLLHESVISGFVDAQLYIVTIGKALEEPRDLNGRCRIGVWSNLKDLTTTIQIHASKKIGE